MGSEPTKGDSMSKPETMMIDDVKYVRADSAPTGSRCVVVVDRGWVFAGDVTRADGRIRLDRAVHVRSWSGIGFDGMLAAPTGGKVVLKAVPPVDMPQDAELFCVPVDEGWGL